MRIIVAGILLMIWSSSLAVQTDTAIKEIVVLLDEIALSDISPDEKIFLIDSCIEISNQWGNDSLVSLGYHKKGISYRRSGRMSQDAERGSKHLNLAFDWYKKAFLKRKSIENISGLRLARSGYFTGLTAYDLNHLDTAEIYFKQILALEETTEYTPRSYGQLAMIAHDKGNYNLAKIYMNQALQFQDLLSETIRSSLYLDKSRIYQNGTKMDLKELIDESPYVLEMLERSNSSTNLSRYHMNIGGSYDELGLFRKALDHYQKAYDLVSDQNERASLLNNMGISNRKLKRFELAENQLNSALRIYKFHDNRDKISYTYDNLGDVFKDQLHFEKAIGYYDSAIYHIWPAYRSTSEDLRKYLDQVFFKSDLLTYLTDRANASLARYRKNSDHERLQETLRYYHLADTLIDIIRYTHPQEATQLYWRDRAKDIYEPAVQAALAGGYADLAFQFMERSKALVLLEALIGTRAEALIPDSTSLALQAIQVEISNLEQKLYLSGDEDTRALLLGRLARHTQMLSEIAHRYPNYYEAKFSFQLTQLQEVQNSLDKGQGVLSFLLTRDTVLGLLITPEEFRFRFLGSRNSLDTILSEYKMLHDRYPQVSIAPIEEYDRYNERWRQNAYRLYLLLIAPWDRLPMELIVIPDENLHQVSFESLLTELPGDSVKWVKYPYLIHRHIFSYNHSASVFMEMKRIKSHGKKVLGLAPQFDRTRYFPLKYSQEEVKSIRRYYPLKALRGSEATRENLEANIDRSIIHFATHALLDETQNEFSFLLLNHPNGGLDTFYLKDVYHLALPGCLVLINACESHAGDEVRGEGMISLARSFTYAGASGLITALRPIYDKQTAEITGRFYRHLSRGLHKSKALYQAKLDYLNEVRDDEFAHPYFWSSLIFLGNDDPIPGRNRWRLYYIAGFIIIVTIAIGRRLFKSKFSPKAS